MNIVCDYIIIILKKIELASTTNLTNGQNPSNGTDLDVLSDIIKTTTYFKKKILKARNSIAKTKNVLTKNVNDNNDKFKVDAKLLPIKQNQHKSKSESMNQDASNAINHSGSCRTVESHEMDRNTSDYYDVGAYDLTMRNQIQFNHSMYNVYDTINLHNSQNNINTDSLIITDSKNTHNYAENSSLKNYNYYDFYYIKNNFNLDNNNKKNKQKSFNNSIIMDPFETQLELDNKHCTRQIKFAGDSVKEYFDSHREVVTELGRIFKKKFQIAKIRVTKDNNVKKLVIHTKTDEDYNTLLKYDWSTNKEAFMSGVTCEPIIQEYPITTLLSTAYDVNTILKMMKDRGVESVERKNDNRTNRPTERIIMYMSTPRAFCNMLKQRKLEFKGEDSTYETAELHVWLRQAVHCTHCLRLNHNRNQCTLRENQEDQCNKCLEPKHQGWCKSKRICRLCSEETHSCMDRFKCPIWIKDTISKNRHFAEVLKIGGVIENEFGIFMEDSITETSMRLTDAHRSPTSKKIVSKLTIAHDDNKATEKLNISEIINTKVNNKLKDVEDKVVEHGIMISNMSKTQRNHENRITHLENNSKMAIDNNRILKLFEIEFLKVNKAAASSDQGSQFTRNNRKRNQVEENDDDESYSCSGVVNNKKKSKHNASKDQNVYNTKNHSTPSSNQTNGSDYEYEEEEGDDSSELYEIPANGGRGGKGGIGSHGVRGGRGSRGGKGGRGAQSNRGKPTNQQKVDKNADEGEKAEKVTSKRNSNVH